MHDNKMEVGAGGGVCGLGGQSHGLHIVEQRVSECWPWEEGLVVGYEPQLSRCASSCSQGGDGVTEGMQR